jgi:hypothetical protein
VLVALLLARVQTPLVVQILIGLDAEVRDSGGRREGE